MHMMERADEVVNMRGLGKEVLHEGSKGRADEFAFEADDDVDLRGIGLLETAGFDDVGVVAGREDLEGGLGIVELYSS